MALLTVQEIDENGFDLAGQLAAADVAGDTVDAASGLFIAIDNADVGAHTLTITKPQATEETKFGALPVSDLVITVPASELHVFTVPRGYEQNGQITWAYDDVTSVSIGVFTLG